MSKIFKFNENEEQEILLSPIQELKSNKSNNSSNKGSNKKFGSSKNLPKVNLSFKDSDKSLEKEESKGINIKPKFVRKKEKIHTLKMPRLSFSTIEKIIKRKRSKANKTRKRTVKKKKMEISKNKENEEGGIKEEEPEKDEFEDKEIKTKLELIFDKKFSPTETMLCYCKGQIYISYDNFSGFDFTGLEGILCIIINRVFSNLYLQMYDIMDFKKQFEIELYTNISLNKGYEIMSEKFHTIEFPTFCIGINFYTKKKAEEIKNIILNYSKALNSSLFYMYDTKNHDSFQIKKKFDFISNPRNFINKDNNDDNRNIINETNTKQKINNINSNSTIKDSINEDNNTYFNKIFDKPLKKLNYKISSDEQMLSFGIDAESNELIFETSKGANRFLEQNNIEISIINEEYEKMKEKIKLKMKNNKAETRKTKKSFQEDLKNKENKEKIIDILNQIEGLQTKDKNLFNLEEEEKQKLNNKIKKFNITKRLAINQKLEINSSPDNMVFYEDYSNESEEDEEGEDIEEEEGEELDDEDIPLAQLTKDVDKIKKIPFGKHNNLDIKNNNNLNNTNNKVNVILKRLSTIKEKRKNSSDVSNSKNENNDNNKNSLNFESENDDKSENNIEDKNNKINE